MPDQTKRAPRVCSPVVTLPRWSLLLRARIQVHTRIIHALHQEWTALGSRCRHNRDVSSNSFAGDILVIPGSIALCRGPRRFVAGATRFTSFASGAAHAQPANPRTSLSTLGPCSCAASFMRRIPALRRLSHPPAKPPCRSIDRQGSWFEPTWRDDGVEPSTPS